MVKKISVIIPVYNEERTITAAILSVMSTPLPGYKKEVIVVNDGSTDNTEKITLQWRDRIIYLKNNRKLGKGAAIRSGLARASGDVILIQDADLEYDFGDIPRLLLLAEAAPAAAVFGSRNLRPKKPGYPLFVFGDHFLTMLVNLVFRTQLTDVFTCYKLIPAKLFKSLDLKNKGFSVEMEITLKLLLRGITIREIPIKYSPRTFNEGKKFTYLRGIRDTFLSLLLLIKAIWIRYNNIN